MVGYCIKGNYTTKDMHISLPFICSKLNTSSIHPFQISVLNLSSDLFKSHVSLLYTNNHHPFSLLCLHFHALFVYTWRSSAPFSPPLFTIIFPKTRIWSHYYHHQLWSQSLSLPLYSFFSSTLRGLVQIVHALPLQGYRGMSAFSSATTNHSIGNLIIQSHYWLNTVLVMEPK